MADPIRNSQLEEGFRSLDPLVPASSSATYCERPEAPLKRMAARIRVANRPGVYLVTGPIGSGKSTELIRLANQLEDEFATSIQTVDSLLQSRKADEIDVFLITLSALAELSDSQPSVSKRVKDAVRSLMKGLTATANSASKVSFGALGLKYELDRDFTREQIGDFRTKLIAQFNDLVEEIEKGIGKRPLVILDGIDKLSVEDVSRTLSRLSRWDQLPLSLIATVPMSFAFSSHYASQSFAIEELATVPAVRVRHRNGSPAVDGIRWFERLLHARGVDQLFLKTAVERLAIASGGIIRDFIRLAREAILNCVVATEPFVADKHALIAIEQIKLEMSRALSEQEVRLLSAVASTGRVIRGDGFQRLIDLGWIAEQVGEPNWYAPHPIMVEVMEGFRVDD